jgi:hypothetical protein
MQFIELQLMDASAELKARIFKKKQIDAIISELSKAMAEISVGTVVSSRSRAYASSSV